VYSAFFSRVKDDPGTISRAFEAAETAWRVPGVATRERSPVTFDPLYA
jgi:hypothetical protein